jgi:hypothetical protein
MGRESIPAFNRSSKLEPKIMLYARRGWHLLKRTQFKDNIVPSILDNSVNALANV